MSQDAEVFYVSRKEASAKEPGWYYWLCSDPYGPFKTEDEAIADAREKGCRVLCCTCHKRLPHRAE